MSGPRRWSSAALLAGALVAWTLGVRSTDAPAGEAPGTEVASADRVAPALLGHPCVTRGERPPSADAEAPDDAGATAAADLPSRDASEVPCPLPVEVLVVDGSGNPVTGADVDVARHRTRTDAEGRARLPAWGFDMGLPSQDRYWKTVRVRARGFVPVAHVGGRAREVIRLDASGGRVSGCCTDADGRPVADVTLALVWRPGPATLETLAVTAGDGRFTFLDAPWTAAQLEVRGTTWSADPIDVVPPQEEVRLVLRPAGVGEPRVPDHVPDGAAPPDVDADAPWIEVDATGVDRVCLHASAVMDDGTVQDLGGLGAGTVVRFPVRSESVTGLLLAAGESETWRQPAAARTSVPLRRPLTAPVRLLLADARGRWVEDGTVSVRWTDVARVAASGERNPRFGTRTVSGVPLEAGAHVVPAVPPGTFDLLWQSGAHHRVVLLRRGLVMPEPAVALDVGHVVVPPPIEVEVLVVDALGPVAGAVVRWTSPGDEACARTDRDGLCRFPVRDPVAPLLEATHPDRGTGRLRPAGDDLSRRVTVHVRPPQAGAPAADR